MAALPLFRETQYILGKERLMKTIMFAGLGAIAALVIGAAIIGSANHVTKPR